MKANLSLVLDKEGYVRVDLKKDILISEIDEYTTACTSSKEIREEYSDEISRFLEEQEAFTRTFKRDQDKKGRVVITYFDEFGKLHRLRVLYKDNKDKTNIDKMIKNIKKALEEQRSFYKSVDVINHFSGFIFGSSFDRNEIKRLKKKLTIAPENESKYNNQLVKNIIYNHLVEALNRNREKAYFYVRLIDSYLEKYGVLTTKKISNLNVRQVPKNTKIEKKPISSIRVKDGDFFREEDGQYNLFGTISNSVSTRQSFSDLHQELLEQDEERRLGK